MQCVSGVPALGRKYGEGVVNGTGADVSENTRREGGEKDSGREGECWISN